MEKEYARREMENQATRSKKASARVKLNPAGPHYSVDRHSTDAEVPRWMGDIIQGAAKTALKKRLGDLNNVNWTNHIKPEVQFATVRWDPEADKPSKSVTVEIDEKSDEWYTSTSNNYPWGDF